VAGEVSFHTAQADTESSLTTLVLDDLHQDNRRCPFE
jgi:hypothetical protein